MNNNVDFLICPKTKKRLKADPHNQTMATEDNRIMYPIVDGIIDLCHENNKQVSKSYDSLSPFYDKILTSANLLTRIYNKLVWGLYDSDYVPELLSFFPDISNKIILDVPVGTGVFTVDLYKKFEKTSRIIVIDYSMGMLKKAKERYTANGINNITYIRSDINNLPFSDNAVDLLLTMNGYHAFPDKDKAFSEIIRVIKPKGLLLGCFYIKGERKFTDFIINSIVRKHGSFSPPFYSFEEVKDIWGIRIDFKHYDNKKSIVYFSGIKR